MKAKFEKILFLALIVLLSPLSVLAGFDYLRSPTGDFINSPVNFYITFDDKASMVSQCGVGEDIEYWSIVAIDLGAENYYYSDTLYSTSSLSGIFSEPLPFSEYQSITSYCLKDTPFKYVGAHYEYDAGGTIFEVGYLTLPILSEFPTDVLAYAGDLFTDLTLVITLAIGLPLGFWVIRKVISLVRAR